jgi:hypothetical protein
MGHEAQRSIETAYEPSLSRLTDPQRLLSPGFTNGFPPAELLPWRALPGAGNFQSGNALEDTRFGRFLLPPQLT